MKVLETVTVQGINISAGTEKAVGTGAMKSVAIFPSQLVADEVYDLLVALKVGNATTGMVSGNTLTARLYYGMITYRYEKIKEQSFSIKVDGLRFQYLVIPLTVIGPVLGGLALTLQTDNAGGTENTSIDVTATLIDRNSVNVHTVKSAEPEKVLDDGILGGDGSAIITNNGKVKGTGSGTIYG